MHALGSHVAAGALQITSETTATLPSVNESDTGLRRYDHFRRIERNHEAYFDHKRFHEATAKVMRENVSQYADDWLTHIGTPQTLPRHFRVSPVSTHVDFF